MSKAHIKLKGQVSITDIESLDYVESLFFRRSISTPSPATHNSYPPSELPEQAQEIKNCALDNSNTATAYEINAQQIYLPNVSDSIEGVFVGSGSRFIKKAKRECFVVDLDINGEKHFLVGTQLQEVITKDIQTGDRILITKVRQFKRAKNREHAQAAAFTVTKL